MEAASDTADGAVSVLRNDPFLELRRLSATSSALDFVDRAALGAILSAMRGRLEGLVRVPGESSSPSASFDDGRVGETRGLFAKAGAVSSKVSLSSRCSCAVG